MNLAQNSDYQVISANEAASIICRFTPEMIEDIIQEAISNNYRNYSQSLANIVESIEINFQMAAQGIPEYIPEINSERNDVYRRIIDIVCKSYNLTFEYHDGDSLYTSAFYIYDFLVSQANLYIINFFVNYINREKSALYDMIEMTSKRKDASPYSRKIYKNSNSKLATIHSNLELVVDNIFEADVDFDLFVDLACLPDRSRSRYLLYILSDNGDFFKLVIVPYFKMNYGTLLTQIKFASQSLATAELADLV